MHKSEFLKVVASEVLKKAQKIPVIAAEDGKKTPTDEATDHAQAYWMLGWSWDEISAVLEDKEFSQQVITKAINNAQNFAYEKLNEGPFKTYKEGQMIKLQNGFVGQYISASPKNIRIQDFETGDVIEASEKQIDRSGSLKLKEAYLLRYGSYKLLRAQEEKEISIPMTVDFPDKPTYPTAPPAQQVVAPKPLDTLDVKVTKKAPPGWGELTPKYSDIQEVQELTATVLAQIEAGREEMIEVDKEAKELNQWIKTVRDRKKDLTKRESELAKQVFSAVGAQQAAMDDLGTTYFERYKDKVIGLQRKIQEIPQEPGVMDELGALKQILEDNSPDIAAQAFALLDDWKKKYTLINEQIVETFAMYPPPQKKSSAKQAQLLDWAKKIWLSVKENVAGMYNKLFPKIEQTEDAIDQFMVSAEGAEKSAASARIEAAVRRMR